MHLLTVRRTPIAKPDAAPAPADQRKPRPPLTVLVGDFMQVADKLRMTLEIAETAVDYLENPDGLARRNAATRLRALIVNLRRMA